MTTPAIAIATISPDERRRLLRSLCERQLEQARRFPVSFGQRRLWLLDQLAPGKSVYNIPLAVRVNGNLRVDILERTLQELVGRHETLRTRFVESDGGEPEQLVESKGRVALEVVDVSAEDPDATALRRAEEEAAKPFRLEDGPLLRALLLRLEPDQHLLVFVMHHIISDGWSMGVFMREVIALYEAFSNNRSSPLPPLTIQYGDYAVRQRRRLTGVLLERSLDYWRKRLEGTPALDLPTDHARPARQSYRGERETVMWPALLTDAAHGLAREERATLFMILLAAYQVLLSRYSGQLDFAIGTVMAGRLQRDTEPLIGFFANTLVLRSALTDEMSFRDVLREVRRTTLEAMEYQELPFEMLVEELNPPRDLSRHPLFQVSFAFQNDPRPSLGLPGLQLTPVKLSSQTTKWDLSLFARELEGRLRVTLEYSSDLFRTETAQRMLEHLRVLLQAAVADADQPVRSLPLICEQERRKVLVEWNDTARNYRRDRCLHHLVDAQVLRTPDAVAVAFEDQQLTYRQLNAQANDVACRLGKLGVGPEVLVGVFLERSLELVVGLLGVLKAGGAYVPVDPTYPAERVDFMLGDGPVPLVLTQKRLAASLRGYSGQIVTLDDEDNTDGPDGRDKYDTSVTPDNAAYVLYTSGSTGKPKGVVITHRAICNHMYWMAEEYPLEPGDALLQKTPISFDPSVWEFFAPLMVGARLVMAQPYGHMDPRYLTRVIQQQRITILRVVPTLLQMLIGEPSFAQCTSLRRLLVGGEALPTELVRRIPSAIRAEVCNMYGPTEAAIVATSMRWDGRVGGTTVPIGRPMANAEAYVLGTDRQLMPIGVPGELYLGGTGLARGYLNRPELTAERFVSHPFRSEAGVRLYRTGDLVRWLPDGNLEFLGRLDHQVKIRGQRIELGEIQSVLLNHPGVREAVVIALDDGSGNKELAAYWVARDGELLAGQLREFLQKFLPSYMIPTVFVALESIPLMPNGKVDYRGLPRPVQQRERQCLYVPPRNPDEEELAAIWSEVLRIERVGIHDNFFALGGHSLLATQVVSRILRRMKVEIPLREMFQMPTIAGLAERIDVARGLGRTGSRPPILPVPRDEELPLSLTQEALWFLARLEPQRTTYTNYPTMRIRGPLDIDALQRALDELIRRHEVLRTTFPERNGRPVQVIAPPRSRPLTIVDLSGLPEEEREAQVQQRLREEMRRAIDLEEGPIIRLTLLRLATDHHVVVIVTHHIIHDGWSTGVLAGEMSALYRSYGRGEPSPLPELPVQYADFAVWQRKLLQGEYLDRLRDYWVKQLTDLPPLDLPTDFPRPAIRSTRGDVRPCRLSPELSTAVREFGHAEGVTPFMILLAAFQVLLGRYSGQDDIAVGSPVANRAQPETEPLIGYFINMLTLRTRLSGQLSFRALVRQVRQTVLEGFEHQDLTLDQVVHFVSPPRDTSRHPLFQAMFVLQNNLRPEAPREGLQFELLQDRPARHAAYFELNLVLTERDGRFRGNMSFNTDLFIPETIERMVNHYQMILADALADPDRALSDLPLVSVTERQQLLAQGDHAAGVQPGPACIHELFEAHVERTPDALALVDGARQWTYRELNERANQLAHALRACGVGPDQAVAVRLPRSAELIAALWGVLKAGGAYLPLDPQLPEDRLRYTLQDARVEVLITLQGLTGGLPAGLRRVICLDADEAQLASQPITNPPPCAGPGDLAYIIYTSGSTGRPKGVMIEHRALVNYTLGAVREYGIRAGDRVLQFASVSYDAHVEEVYPCLTQGGVLVLRSEDALDSFQTFLQRCEQWRLTVLTVPTGFWHELTAAIESQGLRLPASLRLVIIGGEKARSESVAAWFECVGPRVRLLNTYGPTETTVVATSAELSRADAAGERVPIGRPLPNVRIYVLDTHQRPVPIGVRGELYIGGQTVARGYLHREELTTERFLPDPFSSQPHARMYKTGDVVRWRSDGRLEFIGRTDDQVKIRGFRIEPGEIEARLREHPLLAEAAVVACDRAPGDRQLAAYVTARMGAEPALAELRHFLRERLPEHMIPAAFIPLDTMPTTPSGKVDRRALPAPDWSRFALQGEYVAPRTETEQQLAAIWSDVLSIDRVGAHDNFFELGGNSLLALRLASQVRKSFSVDLPLVALFGAPTVIELAQRIVALRTSGRLLDVPPIQPVARGGPLPLSYGQEAMWVISRIQQGRSPYLMHPAARIRGALQLTALEHAFNEILRRHESLRTTFPEVDGQPVQAIAPYASRPLPVVDVSHLPPAEQEAEVRRYALRQSETPLDLATGPLARVEVIRLGEDEHVVLVGLHHIIYDGWSVAVLRRELLATYRAFAAGLPSPLPELPIQYADYAAWQRARLQGEVYEGLREYWRQKLADLPALELPIDHPRPKVRTTHAEATSCRLSSQLSRALKDLALREQATVFMVLLAAFQVLLRRYSGQEDFAIGTPIAGRLRPELENLIGYFVNTLVMRADLSADPTFRELISRVRKTALEGYDHQEMPFERLVQELKPDRDLSRHPLFQVLFVFQSVPFRAEEVSELELGNLETGLGERAADFELLLDATERGEELRLRLSYNRDLFAAATIARLLENFQVLLQAIADDPDRPITRLPLCSPEERRQVLVEWNRTDADYPNAASVHQLFEAQVERTPTEVAVVFEGQQLTYQELNARANQLARSLRSLGVGPDVPVGVCLERSLEMAVAIPAVLKAGGAYLPLDPEYPKQRLRVMLEDAQPAVVVTQQRLLASLPAFAAQRLLVDMDDSIRRRSPENPNWPTDATNLLYVLYTSGSTGRPKGVCLAHRPLVNLLMWQLSESGLGPGARTLQFTSLNFDPSFLEMFATWCAGGTLVMIDEQTRRDPGQLLRFIEQQRIERLYVPFVVLQQLAELGGEAELGDSLREINTAGEQLRVTPQLVDFFHRLGECKLQNQYGPTEAQVVTAHTLSGPPSQWVALPPIGRPLPNVRIYILDTHAQPVPIGVPGELYIGGHPLARGYLKRPDLTAEKFVPDPFASVADARMYRSGDLARWLPNGDIEFLGRADHQVKIRGFRVEPGEIEAVLHEHPSVRQAVVVVRESRAGDKRLVAFIVPDQEQPPTASQLRVFLQPKLPDYMIPAAFVPLPSLPLTPSGKTDRQALPEIGESQREATEAYVEPRTALERQLAEIWREFLHLDRVGIQDDFFELGGHSLLAVRLTARLCAELQVELPVAAVFTSPTVAELAARVAAARRGAQDQRPWELDALRGLTGALRPQETNGARSLVPLRDAASGTPLFCFHGLGGHVAAFLPLARQLQSERPVYGLQALGLAPGQTLHGRIEDMAAWYVEEIGSVQPAGPYLLCGWSLGGLIALESARQLHNAGHETALVAMFDTHLHAMGLDLPEMNDASVLQWIGRQLQVPQHELQRLPLPEQWDLIAERAERYAGLGAEEVRRLAAVCRAQLAAAAQYAPVPYSGCAVLFRASQTRARPDPRWQLLCPQLHVEEVPGNHFSLLRPPAVAVLAERLDRYLAAPESASVPGGGP